MGGGVAVVRATGVADASATGVAVMTVISGVRNSVSGALVVCTFQIISRLPLNAAIKQRQQTQRITRAAMMAGRIQDRLIEINTSRRANYTW